MGPRILEGSPATTLPSSFQHRHIMHNNEQFLLHPLPMNSQHTPMLVQCWASVEDDGPTLYQH